MLNKSHKLLAKHPNVHTNEELKLIKDYISCNPNIILPELYGKLRTELSKNKQIKTVLNN